jgi:hypothetical protein
VPLANPVSGTFHLNGRKAMSETPLQSATVRMIDGLACPQCRRAICPHDFEDWDGGWWRIVCHGCHGVIVAIEPFTQPTRDDDDAED